MTLAALHVIDVGHGNCAIVVDDGWALMVDAGASSAVVESIAHLRLDALDTIVVSHRDFDHARGIVPLLAREELRIGQIFIGADAAKNPSAPETANLLVALADAKRGGRCRVSRDLDDTIAAEQLSGPNVAVEVLAPTFATAMTGSAGQSPAGGRLSSNSVSAVLRITLPDARRVLLPGDMDDVTLKELLANEADLSAEVLVFPHHGSLGTVPDERKFARDVMRAVGASTVLFSVGRAQRARPTDSILAGIFDVSPTVHIACTQLSSGCRPLADPLPRPGFPLPHLSSLPAAGRAACTVCAGSMTFGGSGDQPDQTAHTEYLNETATRPACVMLRPA